MTEDIPLEITSREMASLPIFIAALIVAAVIARICVSVKRKEQPPVFRVLWCATLLIPLGVVTAWIANQLLANEGNSLWILSYSALGAAAVALLVEPPCFGAHQSNRCRNWNGCLHMPRHYHHRSSCGFIVRFARNLLQ